MGIHRRELLLAAGVGAGSVAGCSGMREMAHESQERVPSPASDDTTCTDPNFSDDPSTTPDSNTWGTLKALPETAWTWFTGPRSVYSNEKTYIGGCSSTGDVLVGCYDHRTGERDTTVLNHDFDVDDHSNVALLVRNSDRRIVAAYTTHGENGDETQPIVRISNNPEDISSWGSETVIQTNRGVSSYAQLAQLSAESDRIYLFFRDHSYPKPTAVVRSDDGGRTWGQQIDIATAPQGEYWRIGTDGISRIDLGLTFSENGSSHKDVKHVYIQDGSIYASDGARLASLDGDAEGSLITHKDATMVYDSSETGRDAWIWDTTTSEGNPQLVFASFGGETDHDYHYARWDDGWTSYKIADAGEKIYPKGGQPHYSPGIHLDPNSDGRLFAAIGDSDSSSIEKFETDDGGETWSQSQVYPDDGMNLRPVVPYHHECGARHALPVVWMHGEYTSYTEYSTDIMGIAELNLR